MSHRWLSVFLSAALGWGASTTFAERPAKAIRFSNGPEATLAHPAEADCWEAQLSLPFGVPSSRPSVSGPGSATALGSRHLTGNRLAMEMNLRNDGLQSSSVEQNAAPAMLEGLANPSTQTEWCDYKANSYGYEGGWYGCDGAAHCEDRSTSLTRSVDGFHKLVVGPNQWLYVRADSQMGRRLLAVARSDDDSMLRAASGDAPNYSADKVATGWTWSAMDQLDVEWIARWLSVLRQRVALDAVRRLYTQSDTGRSPLPVSPVEQSPTQRVADVSGENRASPSSEIEGGPLLTGATLSVSLDVGPSADTARLAERNSDGRAPATVWPKAHEGTSQQPQQANPEEHWRSQFDDYCTGCERSFCICGQRATRPGDRGAQFEGSLLPAERSQDDQGPVLGPQRQAPILHLGL